MSATQLFVLLAGLGAILWVNWYFFVAGRGAAALAASTSSGIQTASITVLGGYSPSTIKVKKGGLVRLTFDRQETSGCSEEIVFPEFGIRKFLPAHQKTTVEFTPDRTGSFEFTCGMSMLRGTLIVEDS
jgi:plastocyanin domain-containing protein